LGYRWSSGKVTKPKFKNNRLIKIGNSCLISTLPYNYAIDMKKTAAGNTFCIPKNDELNKTTILRNDGSLTKDEENALS
jgi:hypothetical protein